MKKWIGQSARLRGGELGAYAKDSEPFGCIAISMINHLSFCPAAGMAAERYAWPGDSSGHPLSLPCRIRSGICLSIRLLASGDEINLGAFRFCRFSDVLVFLLPRAFAGHCCKQKYRNRLVDFDHLAGARAMPFRGISCIHGRFGSEKATIAYRKRVGLSCGTSGRGFFFFYISGSGHQSERSAVVRPEKASTFPPNWLSDRHSLLYRTVCRAKLALRLSFLTASVARHSPRSPGR